MIIIEITIIDNKNNNNDNNYSNYYHVNEFLLIIYNDKSY